MKIKNAQKVTISKDRDHYHAHIGATQLKNGDMIVLYNETRGRRHEDFDTNKEVPTAFVEPPRSTTTLAFPSVSLSVHACAANQPRRQGATR